MNTTHLNQATLDDVTADPTDANPDESPEIAEIDSVEEVDSSEEIEEPEAPGGPEGPHPSAGSEPAPPKAKKKSKKQAELKAEIKQLEAQVKQLETDSPTDERSRPARLAIPVVAGVVIVALAVGLVLTGLRLRHADVASSARTSAIAAAKTYAVDLSTYDYRHLSQDFGTVTAHSTASFAKTFTKQSSLLKPVLTKYKATAKAKITAVGVTSSSASRAIVLVLLTQTVTNTVQKKGPTTDTSQVSLTLVRQGGHWVIEDAQLL